MNFKEEIEKRDKLINFLNSRVNTLENQLQIVLNEVKRSRENRVEVESTNVVHRINVKINDSTVGKHQVADVMFEPETRFNRSNQTVAAVPSSTGFFPEQGIVKSYFVDTNGTEEQANSKFDEDMLVLRAYLREHKIDQDTFTAQRDAMTHALRGGASFGYQGSNFTHDTTWKGFQLNAKGKVVKPGKKVKGAEKQDN